MENERKMAERYRARLRQAETIGEFALVETLCAIMVRRDSISLPEIKDIY